ncbi:hypothetical protein LQ327_17110 [Actinomycetospora endophytica]|uniref:DUF559 domain-containing protein n=1 Tax=Actinomycetospora endophytica TaxID=2291215 RepID=A0ABS8PAN2_9PSEU|nr:hypothetical protein [Actinomycetospora endophytica]MCD2195088.1 hypothetical protein [Actinomycetospora endophytica]
MEDIAGPFRASEAIAAGKISRGRVAGPSVERLFPDVHVLSDQVAGPADLAGRAAEAALYVEGAVIGGYAAAELLGASCGRRTAPVDLVVGRRRVRPRPGLRIRQDVLAPAEIEQVEGLLVTTALRTAWDLVRELDPIEGVVALDALARRGGFDPTELLATVESRPRSRGASRVPEAVARADRRSGSPPETRMRLGLVDHGVPPPVPQLEVCDGEGWFVGHVDLGWEEAKVAAEYQGDHHRTDRDQWMHDQARFAELAGAGWLVLPCTAQDLRFPRAFAKRVLAALAARKP